jgi:hypothetical protein
MTGDLTIFNKLKLKNAMISILLGKILFPHLQPWRREREARTVLAAALVALLLAGAIAWVIYSRYSANK